MSSGRWWPSAPSGGSSGSGQKPLLRVPAHHATRSVGGRVRHRDGPDLRRSFSPISGWFMPGSPRPRPSVLRVVGWATALGVKTSVPVEEPSARAARHTTVGQADQADRLDLSRQTVNAIEAGRYDPSLPLASKIVQVFDEPIESLFFPRRSWIPQPRFRTWSGSRGGPPRRHSWPFQATSLHHGRRRARPLSTAWPRSRPCECEVSRS